MKKALLRWGSVLAVVGVCALLLALRVPQGFSALKSKHEQLRGLQKENADVTRDIAEKRERIRKLRESRSEQELEIRRRLKLQREGETSIVPDQERKDPARP